MRLSVFSAVFNIISSFVILSMVVRPLYFLRGSVEGEVSLLYYRVAVLGQRYVSSGLDFVSVASFTILVSNFLVIVFSIFLIFKGDKFVDGMFGAVLSNLVSSGILRGLLNIVSSEVASMNRIRSLSTTAGYIWFPETRIESTPALNFLNNFYLIIIIFQVVLASIIELRRVWGRS